MEPIERVQALADISRSALCCHSNETRAPNANPPNSAQLEGTPYQWLSERGKRAAPVGVCPAAALRR